MSKRPSTQFGEPLSDESLKFVREVRRLVTFPLHPNFDTDFNIYRFVACAERAQKSRRDVVESAASALNQHLRLRKCLKLDELPDIPFERNRLFRDRLVPFGRVLNATDRHNRLLWFIEYASMSVETIAGGIRSSESIRSQFWQFEHMLRLVNRQERKSGRLSSIRHVVDMSGYEISPFTAVFVSSGTLSYYSQLLHYENYPELVYPIEMVNIAKWIHLPYRLIRGMMPAGFADRFRLHDGHFLHTLAAEIPVEHIPHTLGGKNESIQCVPATRLVQPWQPAHPHLLDALECLHVGARKAKCIRVSVDDTDGGTPGAKEGGGGATGRRSTLSWYFRTDGDIFFGVFFEPKQQQSAAAMADEESAPPEQMEHQLEWVYPYMKLGARLHHEWDCVDCSRAGTYWLLFSNKHCWLHRRTVEALVQVDSAEGGVRRVWHGGDRTAAAEAGSPGPALRECLHMCPLQMFGPTNGTTAAAQPV